MATRVLLSAEEFAEFKSPDDRDYELVRGALVEVTRPSLRHGEIMAEAGSLLSDWNRRTKAGLVVVGDPGFILRRGPDTVRGPDVAFVRRERADAARAAGIWPEFGPDFIIEVRSPSNTWREIRERIADFFLAGTRLALVLEPEKFAQVYRPGDEAIRLEPDEVFAAEDVLPGFHCRVSDFFPTL